MIKTGEVAEWTKAADCKSAGASLRRFESRLPLNKSAHVAQTAEHILGKDEVGGSNPLVGLRIEKTHLIHQGGQ